MYLHWPTAILSDDLVGDGSSRHGGGLIADLRQLGNVAVRNRARVLSPNETLARRIRARLRRHLLRLGFQTDAHGNLQRPADSKASVRSLHRLQRLERLRENELFLRRCARS